MFNGISNFVGYLMSKTIPVELQLYWLVGWLVVLFYGVSTLFESFDAELSHFDKSFKQFGLVVVFANGPGNLGSIPGSIIPKTLKMVLDTFLLNTQQYKVRIKGKVEQSRERSSSPLHFGVLAIEKRAFWSPSTKVANFTFLLISIVLCLHLVKCQNSSILNNSV